MVECKNAYVVAHQEEISIERMGGEAQEMEEKSSTY